MPTDVKMEDLSPSVPLVSTAPHERWISESGITYYRKVKEPQLLPLDGETFRSIPDKQKLLCWAMTNAGCPAVPYSVGSHLERSELKDRFNMLKKDEMAIRTKGTTLTNAQTGEKVDFKDRSYKLPWSKFDVFFERYEEAQREGSFSFFVPSNKVEECENLKANKYESPFAEIRHERSVGEFEQFSIEVKCPTAELNEAEWNILMQYLLPIFMTREGEAVENDHSRQPMD